MIKNVLVQHRLQGIVGVPQCRGYGGDRRLATRQQGLAPLRWTRAGWAVQGLTGQPMQRLFRLV